jgi:DNA topoisomerase I
MAVAARAHGEDMSMLRTERANLGHGLRFSSDSNPGFARRRAGRGFAYRDVRDRPIRDPAVLARIRALAVPPAWRDVWICADPHGHLQAVGRDARGRKQARYHPGYRAQRDELKFDRVAAFGRALPAVRRRVDDDLARPGLPRERILATVVRLLETTYLRVGNEEYARTNKSFGLTTLRNRHVIVDTTKVQFRFRGKGGKVHTVGVRDRRIARIVERCQSLPGQELFQYLDQDGEPHPIESTDVNAYLREASGIDITAKDFRTWTGTMLAFRALRSSRNASPAEAKASLKRSVEEVAEALGNTPAISRKSYIAPAIVEAHLAGRLPPGTPVADAEFRLATPPTRREELALIRLLGEMERSSGRSQKRDKGRPDAAP